MNCCVSDNKLRLVKGDTLSLNISLTDVDIELIDKVYFTCTQQNIRKELILQDNQFMLNIDPSQTALFKEVTSDYDITIVFKNGETSTVVYRSGFTVLPKTNKLIDYEDSYIVTEVKELPEANAGNENRILIYNNTPYISVNKDGIYQWEELAGKSYVDNTYVDFNFTANDETNTINLTMTTLDGKTKQMSVLRDNVDFTNYYTKTEVDEKLGLYVSNNELNNKLLDYYNKLEVDNLLANLDVGVKEEDVMNIVENNSEQVDSIDLEEVSELPIGTSTDFNGEDDEQIPTSKAVSQEIDNKINVAINDILSEEY